MTLHPVKNVSNRRTDRILHGLSNMSPTTMRPLERNINVGRMKADEMRLQLFKPVTTSKLKRRTVKTLLRKTKPDRSIATVKTVINNIEEITIQVRNGAPERVRRRPMMIGNHVKQLITSTRRVKAFTRALVQYATVEAGKNDNESITTKCNGYTKTLHPRECKTQAETREYSLAVNP
jgi:hypothetical protein